MDRRRHPRVPYGAWIENLTQEGTIQFYLSQNISIGGMLLQSEAPPLLGHKVHLRLVIENEARVVSIEGTVVRHEPQPDGKFFFGVTFIDLDEAKRAFIADLVEECAKDSDIDIATPSHLADA